MHTSTLKNRNVAISSRGHIVHMTFRSYIVTMVTRVLSRLWMALPQLLLCHSLIHYLVNVVQSARLYSRKSQLVVTQTKSLHVPPWPRLYVVDSSDMTLLFQTETP